MSALDQNTILLLALCGGLGGLVAFLAFLGYTVRKLRDWVKETAVIRYEVELSRPVLNSIAAQFRNDSGNTLKDSFDRFEVAVDVLQKAVDVLQRTVEMLSRQQLQQGVINDQTETLLSNVVLRLNGVLEEVARRGEIRAAEALEKLIAELQVDRQTLRAHSPSINVNLAGAGSNVGQSASGAGIAQAGLSKAQDGLAKTQEGVAQIEKGIEKVKEQSGG